jgi:hypothetical protein
MSVLSEEEMNDVKDTVGFFRKLKEDMVEKLFYTDEEASALINEVSTVFIVAEMYQGDSAIVKMYSEKTGESSDIARMKLSVVRRRHLAKLVLGGVADEKLDHEISSAMVRYFKKLEENNA